jgi:hypothetical protein
MTKLQVKENDCKTKDKSCMMHIWTTFVSSKGCNFYWCSRRENIVKPIAPNKMDVCYSFAKVLGEGHISEMRVDTQRSVTPKK